MRRVLVFSGSSHPKLTQAICDRLGINPAKCELGKFSNGETRVDIGTSIRDKDVFVVQSGCHKTNDCLMELLILISACKVGSARSITAVMPYFPYSRQSKKKSHRGAITARMIANLLSVAGVNHIITVDLHAPPMQGFFGKPVDNLHAEPVIARWIKLNVKGWQNAVVVSKNPGGSKRVTSLADTLKLSFGIITTDRRRSPPLGSSMILDTSEGLVAVETLEDSQKIKEDSTAEELEREREEHRESVQVVTQVDPLNKASTGFQSIAGTEVTPSRLPTVRGALRSPVPGSSPLFQAHRGIPDSPRPLNRLQRSQTTPSPRLTQETGDGYEEYTDERAREVITGRLVQGHIVDDNFPSPMLSTMSGSVPNLASIGQAHFEDRDPMMSSFMSTASSVGADLTGQGTFDMGEISEEEEEERLKDPEVEYSVTLVGNVHNKTVVIIDDIMDRAESWIAAAETVVKRGGATKVYCVATHGLFGEDALGELEKCDCIDFIVVCNTFPFDNQKAVASKKLHILDLSSMLTEAIRRNHYGESITQMYQDFQDQSMNFPSRITML